MSFRGVPQRQLAVHAKLVEQGSAVIPGTPEEFGSFIREEYFRWKKVVTEAKLVAD